MDLISEMHDIFHHYLETYAHRDLEELKKIISSQLSGFGTGEDEHTLRDLTFLDLYQRDVEQIPKNLNFTIYDEQYQQLSADCFIALAIIDITSKFDGESHTLFSNRMSCVFHKSCQNNKFWELEHMHLSTPLPIQQSGESAPIQEYRRRNEELKLLVKAKTKELISINETLSQKNVELEKTLQEVKTLKGLLPICANCKKIRNDQGYWQNIEEYFLKNTDIKLTHGICDDCMKILYSDIIKVE